MLANLHKAGQGQAMIEHGLRVKARLGLGLNWDWGLKVDFRDVDGPVPIWMIDQARDDRNLISMLMNYSCEDLLKCYNGCWWWSISMEWIDIEDGSDVTSSAILDSILPEDSTESKLEIPWVWSMKDTIVSLILQEFEYADPLPEEIWVFCSKVRLLFPMVCISLSRLNAGLTCIFIALVTGIVKSLGVNSRVDNGLRNMATQRICYLVRWTE